MTANSFVKNAWYVAGMTPEFETNQLHGTTIVKKPVVMWRTSEGKVVAFDDRCVHKKMRFPAASCLPTARSNARITALRTTATANASRSRPRWTCRFLRARS